MGPLRLCSAFLGVLALLPGTLHAMEPGLQSAGSSPQTASPTTAQLVEYGELLQALRSGHGDTEPALLQSAFRLAGLGRTDALAVARFYVDLPAEARRAGLQAEGDFFDIRERVQAAENLRGKAWQEVREIVQTDLLALINAHGAAPDPTPAARAHALLARLQVSRLDRDGSMPRHVALPMAESAFGHASTSIELFSGVGQRTPQLEPLWLMAELGRLRGQGQAAQSRYRELAELAEFTGRLDYRIRALRGLVRLARESGDPLRVERLLREWASIQSPQASWELANEHALWLLSAGQAQATMDFLWKCKPAEPKQLLRWQALSCSALRMRGHLEAARHTLQSMARQHPEEVELLALTGALQWQAEGRLSQAEDALLGWAPFETWSAQGRVQAWTLLGDLLMAQGQPRRALAPLRRALREAQGWEARRLGPGSVSGEWLGLHAVVLAAQAAAENGDPVLAATLLEENQARDLRRARNDSLGGAAPQSALRQRLQSLRNKGAGIMTFAFGARFGFSVHLGPNGQSQARRIDVTRGSLQTGIARLRQAIQQDDGPRARAILAELSPIITGGIGPWAGDPQTAPESLRLILHGPLEELPVAMLSQDSRPLDQLFELVCNHSLWTGAQSSLRAPDWGRVPWRFLGAPNTRNYEDLPAAATELSQLAQDRPGSLLQMGGDFQRAAMHMALTGQDAVHLATHLVRSTHCDDPELQAHGLLLDGDQILCASTVRSWSPNPPLVFLGTCASAGGLRVDGEGQLGLARALQAGGTRNLIVTLWPVSDGGSAAFARAFHAAMEQGAPPSQATAQARALLREAGHSMRDWSGFLHLGLD
ncbi:MAG: CHAT domain-containing protein [Planctomycetota bacterium]|nr:CHAT domain-containing protein [Planctomycetota bacterium]